MACPGPLEISSLFSLAIPGFVLELSVQGSPVSSPCFSGEWFQTVSTV